MTGHFARSRVLCSLCVFGIAPQIEARPAHSINLLVGSANFSL